MKSLRKSVGKVFPILIGFGLVVGCGSGPEKNSLETDQVGEDPVAKVQEELKEEISLRADRSHLDELRKEIPDEKRRANDELALLTHLLTEVKMPPSEVQARYQRIVRTRREAFRKKVSQLRNNFNRTEKKRRDDFLNESKRAREEFKKIKADREYTKEFFADQEAKRRTFFDAEKDRRKAFESELRSQTQDFEAYMRERNKEFQEQARLYAKRYHELKREQALSSQNKDVKHIKNEPVKPPAQILAPDDKGP